MKKGYAEYITINILKMIGYSFVFPINFPQATDLFHALLR
jgi:hypothetical protein